MNRIIDRKGNQPSDWAFLLQIKDRQLPNALEAKIPQGHGAEFYLKAKSSWVALCLLRRFREADKVHLSSGCFECLSPQAMSCFSVLQQHLMKNSQAYGLSSPAVVRTLKYDDIEALLQAKVVQAV